VSRANRKPTRRLPQAMNVYVQGKGAIHRQTDCTETDELLRKTSSSSFMNVPDNFRLHRRQMCVNFVSMMG